MLNLVLAQLNPIVGDIAFNQDKILQTCRDAPDDNDLVIFPEMMLCGYPPEDLILKPAFINVLHSATEEIIEASKSFNTALLLPTPWEKDGKIYNAAHLIQNGEIIDTLYKHHLPNYGTFDEKRLFEGGAIPSPVSFKGYKLGIMICEDMWLDDVAAHLKKEGAEIFIAVNASPYSVQKNDTRIKLAKKRCTENNLPLIYVNQCGGQDELVFDGASFAMNEAGALIMQGDIFTEQTHQMSWTKNDNGHWLCDAEPLERHNYDPLEEIYIALMIGLRDYVSKNSFNGVILGLSGGIDSAMAATIAVDALGADNVQCVMMPSKYTSQESLDDAAAVAKALNVHLDTVSIEDAVKTFGKTLASHFTSGTPDITHENIQSRCRGLILMALSNAHGKMVLTAGNKSEMAVGYATLYGDMCGGFNALKDIYKTKLYELAAWRNKHKPKHSFGPHNLVIAENIISKAPTAELKPDQTDQDSLPAYDVLDDILHGLIEEDLGTDALIKRGHDRETIQKVWHLLDRAEYKRRQSPPGTKVTTRNFGRDRRYPITNHFHTEKV
jgi:NAD+ synthase